MSRYFFEPPRRPKAKPGAGIKSLLVRCPSTSKLTDTGQQIEQKLWETTRVKNGKFTCVHCGRVHIWSKKDVILGRPASLSR